MTLHKKKKPIELLAPARNAECGMEAIRHGADAVYIGGPSFGARQAAGNSINDIKELCEYAHIFGARIYVTLNTILWDSELDAAQEMVWDLYRAGVDALIVQDLALLELNLPPIALHASTQMDNCTPEKAQFLEAAGFRQIVLARETSLEQTRAIANAVKVPIEAFVHGALCVSYSGRCYASQYCFDRSANRGRCAQFCRLSFDLVDGNNKTIVTNKHLLSLRDMNRSAHLLEMMEAGVRSFKIEGRLKDMEYVKNVTAYYRERIDEILAHSDEFVRASYGQSTLNFTPDVNRSFNRGFTEYFLHGRTATPIHSFHSPKATGPEVAMVKRCEPRSFTITPSTGLTSPITAGDGLCFIDVDGKLQGFRVNKVEGNRIYPARMLRMAIGTKLHRNLDFEFDKTLAKPTAKRQLTAQISLREIAQGYALDIADETGCHVTLSFEHPHEAARSPQRAAIERQLGKLGDTPFIAENINIETNGERFIPASVLTEWRRQICETLLRCHRMSYDRDYPGKVKHESLQELLPKHLPYSANVSNHLSEKFYHEHGVQQIDSAFEIDQPKGEAILMTCRHCIRHALGICLKKGGHSVTEPLTLRLPDGRSFKLKFDCARCEMQVLKS